MAGADAARLRLASGLEIVEKGADRGSLENDIERRTHRNRRASWLCEFGEFCVDLLLAMTAFAVELEGFPGLVQLVLLDEPPGSAHG